MARAGQHCRFLPRRATYKRTENTCAPTPAQIQNSRCTTVRCGGFTMQPGWQDETRRPAPAAGQGRHGQGDDRVVQDKDETHVASPSSCCVVQVASAPGRVATARDTATRHDTTRFSAVAGLQPLSLFHYAHAADAVNNVWKLGHQSTSPYRGF
jgi:hypothetical protein